MDKYHLLPGAGDASAAAAGEGLRAPKDRGTARPSTPRDRRLRRRRRAGLGSHTHSSPRRTPARVHGARDRQRAPRSVASWPGRWPAAAPDLSDLLIHQEQDLSGVGTPWRRRRRASSFGSRTAWGPRSCRRHDPRAPPRLVHGGRPWRFPCRSARRRREGTATSACFGWADGGEDLMR